ncbi:MAG TPA: hypothetical protein DEO88_06575 [Syntrophobacteraceae bacterium]|jgi:hypothetical protein|nr:hypothetical protein [Syntrophobacteraceae bacterium]
MSRFPSVSLRSRLMMVVILAVLPALIVTFYSGLRQRQRALADTRATALALARDLSDAQEEIVGNTHRILVTLAQLPQVIRRDPEASTAVLARLLRLSEGSTNIVACDSAGQVFANVIPLIQPISYSDREWFQRVLQTHSFVISDFLIGRINGKPEVILANPVVDDSGHLQGVLHTALRIDWLNRFIAKRNLPQGVTGSVIDRNGTVLAHYPHPEQFIGKSAAEIPVVKRVLDEIEGVAELPGLNGEAYVFGYASLRKVPGSMHTVVGTP